VKEWIEPLDCPFEIEKHWRVNRTAEFPSTQLVDGLDDQKKDASQTITVSPFFTP
jgi:hypothetical protein